MELGLMIIGLIAATGLIWSFGPLSRRYPAGVSNLGYVNFQIRYQGLLLFLALLVLGICYLIKPEELHRFFALGDIGAPAIPTSWLGIAPGESWLSAGIAFTITVTLVTFSFMFLQLRASKNNFPLLWPYFPWILLFALTNSFAEEIVYRLSVIVLLWDTATSGQIMMVSAIAFGAAHLRGMPNGLIGMIIAGILGWILAKATMETQGLFWAWLVHFLQDVVIISALTLGAAGEAIRERVGSETPPVARTDEL